MVQQTNTNPFAAWEIADHMRQCIEPYLGGTSAGLPERSCVTSGAIAWDDCECGQLIVSMQTKYPGGNFPAAWAGNDQGGMRNCGPPLMVFTYLVAVQRCAPVMDDSGNPPSCQALSDAARVASEDAWAVLAGLTCCLDDAIKGTIANRSYLNYEIGTQTFSGPEGGCQGSEVPVTVAVKHGCYPCDIS